MKLYPHWRELCLMGRLVFIVLSIEIQSFMKFKGCIFVFVLSVFGSIIYAQESIPEMDKIIFSDGTIKEGKLKLNDFQGIKFNGKVKLCNGGNNKDCITYQINDIDEIIQAPSQLMINQFKILNSENPPKRYQKLLAKNEDPEKLKIENYIQYYKVLYYEGEENGSLSQLMYSGQSADFYFFSRSGKDGGKTYITKPNSAIILFSFNSTPTSDKYSLKKLTEFFSDCEAFTNESTKSNAHKKHEMRYFYELSDKCSAN